MLLWDCQSLWKLLISLSVFTSFSKVSKMLYYGTTFFRPWSFFRGIFLNIFLHAVVKWNYTQIPLAQNKCFSKENTTEIVLLHAVKIIVRSVSSVDSCLRTRSSDAHEVKVIPDHYVGLTTGSDGDPYNHWDCWTAYRDIGRIAQEGNYSAWLSTSKHHGKLSVWLVIIVLHLGSSHCWPWC